MIVPKVGDKLRSYHKDSNGKNFVHQIIAVFGDGNASWRCLQGERLVGIITTATNTWNERYWEILPSKSRNFSSLYEKLSNG